MKNKIILTLLGLLMIAGGFEEGCEDEEPKPDYITVNVTPRGTFVRRPVGWTSTICDEVTKGKTVRVDIVKAGGETFNFYATVDTDICQWQAASTATFKLYREQPIETTAYSEQVPGGYTQVRGVDYLSWDEVYPQFDFGDTYNYSPDVQIIWLED